MSSRPIPHSTVDPDKYPVEPKVTAATTAATVTAFILYLLGAFVFHDDTIPRQVESFIMLVVTGGVTFGAGYYAKHQYRITEARRNPLP